MRIPFVTIVLMSAAAVASAGCMSAASDPLPRHSVYLRGTVHDLNGLLLTVVTASGPVPVFLIPVSRVSMVVASDRGHLKDGMYMGVTSVPQPDGSLRAVEIHIFPAGESRTGAGSFTSDLSELDAGGAAMTNGTTTHAAARPAPSDSETKALKPDDGEAIGISRGRHEGGTSLTLMFKSSSMVRTQSLTIPWGVPIVTFESGRMRDLKPGAHVIVIATRNPEGDLCVSRVLVGRNGLVPPL